MTINEKILMHLMHQPSARLSDVGKFNLDTEFHNEHANKIGVINKFSVNSLKGIDYLEFKVSENYSFDCDSIDEIELLLRPWSDLLIPIDFDGETFIPIERLLAPHINIKASDVKIVGSTLVIDVKIIGGLNGTNLMTLEFDRMQLQYAIPLLKWGFDLFDLVGEQRASYLNDK